MGRVDKENSACRWPSWAGSRKVLHVSPWMAKGIDGHEDPDGEELLLALCDEVVQAAEGLCYSHQWHPADMVIWGNWRVLHSMSGMEPVHARSLRDGRRRLHLTRSWEAGPVTETDGAKSFRVSGDAYDQFMGRYSQLLAGAFADAAGATAGDDIIDVGCGSGALTAVLVDRVGGGTVRATDPSESFVAHCAARFPGLDIRRGRAEAIPFDTDSCDRVLAQLVFHFVSEPEIAVGEMKRVARPGGTVAACVWDFAEGMEMLRAFWDAALEVDPSAPDEARLLRFGGAGEIAELFERAGLEGVIESSLSVASTYTNFEELWSTFLLGIGPAGAYCVSLPPDAKEAVKVAFNRRLDSPDAEFSLAATARCAVAHTAE